MDGRRHLKRKRGWQPAIFIMSLGVMVGLVTRAPVHGAENFYEGKTIQFLVSSGTGATTDISARLVARYLTKYIPGKPGIIVQNMPGGGGFVGANYLYNVAKPDGLTILAVSRANYLDQMVGRPEVKTDFRKLAWIGSFNKAPMMAACRSDTPYKSIQAIRAAKVPPRFGTSGTGSDNMAITVKQRTTAISFAQRRISEKIPNPANNF